MLSIKMSVASWTGTSTTDSKRRCIDYVFDAQNAKTVSTSAFNGENPDNRFEDFLRVFGVHIEK